MNQVEKHGEGIILMHDFKQHTAEALPELIRQLKAGGYKVVHMKPKEPVKTIAQYDEMVAKEVKLPGFRPGKAPRRLLEARMGSEIARDQATPDPAEFRPVPTIFDGNQQVGPEPCNRGVEPT